MYCLTLGQDGKLGVPPACSMPADVPPYPGLLGWPSRPWAGRVGTGGGSPEAEPSPTGRPALVPPAVPLARLSSEQPRPRDGLLGLAEGLRDMGETGLAS